MSPFAFAVEPFQPHPMLQNPHLQTLLSRYLRRGDGIAYRRVRLDTPDGDFVDVDFADVPAHTWSQLGDDAPLALILHGLEGYARAPYCATLYRNLAANGWRPVGMNFRSCSGEMNRTARLYHMGATQDVALVFDWLEAQFPDVHKVIIGFSLGGNITLKFLGENGAAMRERVLAAVAISTPFISTGEQRLNHGVGALYGRYLLSSLKRKVRLKAAQMQAAGADVYAGLTAPTLRAYDDAITAPLFGFVDSQDYYAQCNSIRFLPDVRVPTLIMRAQDDPFFNQDIPHDVIAANPYLYPAFPKHGGHVGFLAGFPPNHHNWSQAQAVRFVNAALKQGSSG